MVGVHRDVLSAPMDLASLADRVDLAAEARKLPPATRAAITAISGGVLDMRIGDGATKAKFDLAYGLVTLGGVDMPGSVLRDQVVGVLTLIAGPLCGPSVGACLAALTEDQSAAFRAICAIVAEVRRR
jgi:hypothetical protein